MNSHLKEIGIKLGISEKLVTYVARHSLAPNNTSILFISQSLGYTNIGTTQKYLAGFEEEQVQDYLKTLI